jgi:hypothetical protein
LQVPVFYVRAELLLFIPGVIITVWMKVGGTK